MKVRIGYHGIDYNKPETLPIGYIYGKGFRADNILEAWGQVLGPIPSAPELLPPGKTDINGLISNTNVLSEYSYDPGPGNYDRSHWFVQDALTAISAYSAKATTIKQMIDKLIAERDAKQKPKPKIKNLSLNKRPE
jgi:hypothetical protein